MIYPICHCCGAKLGHLQIPYEEGLKKITERENTGEITQEESDKLKKELVNSLGLQERRYCCRQLLLTYVNSVSIVK